MPGEDRRGFLRDSGGTLALCVGAHQLVAAVPVLPPVSVQSGDQPVHQIRGGVTAVVGLMPVEEVGLVLRQFELGGDREAVVREVEVLPVGQDVLEVRVEVQEPAVVHERDTGRKFPLDHGAGPVGDLVACFDLSAQPLVQVLRDVLTAQGEGCGDCAVGSETRTARHVRNVHCCLHLDRV